MTVTERIRSLACPVDVPCPVCEQTPGDWPEAQTVNDYNEIVYQLVDCSRCGSRYSVELEYGTVRTRIVKPSN